MEAFKLLNTDYKINIFTGGRDFNEIMNLLPHEEFIDMGEEYLALLEESDESELESIREGFKYLYGQFPEDLTEEDLRGITIDDITHKAELICDGE